MSATAGSPATAADAFTAPEYRIEGRDKVTGTAQYSADFAKPGMLWAAFLSSPVAHARIASIDTAAAREMPGVYAVLTGADIGEHYFGRALCDWPVLAVDRVLFIGQYVAAAAAETREQAEAAVRAIDVAYAELPVIFEPHEALADGALVLHEHPEKYPFLYGNRPPVPHPNVQGHVAIAKGDLAAGFAAADRSFEHRFTTPRYHGGYIEPHSTLVWIADDGILHVVSSNKAPFALRGQMAAATGLPPESIVVEQAYIGGDFGAKGLSVDEFPCYYLARATKRPVKFMRSYLDDLQSTNVRHAAEIRVTSGVTADGRFTALDVEALLNGGAFGAGKPVPTMVPGTPPKLPYRVPNGRVTVSAVYTNTVPAGHVRAPADVQIFFAIESHIDMVARELGIDPLEFRLRNAIRGDESDIDGGVYREPRAVDVLERLREVSAWGTPLPAGHGRGISLGARHIGHGRASLVLKLERGGTIRIRTTMTDQGVGALTMIQRVVARALGLETGRIAVVSMPTDAAPMDMGPGASRVTHVTGQAALDAAAKLRVQLETAGWSGAATDWDAAVRRLLGEAESLEITGSHDGFPKAGEPEFHNFSAYMAEVSVDHETGALTLHDVVYVVDVGTIVNPVAHRGQIDGGFIFGLGHTLTEELVLEDGKITNLSLGEYKLPCQRDAPPFRVVQIDEPVGPGPYGAKAAGEISTSGVPAAIANAVAAACGARITTLPITAERIYAALRAG